MQDLFEGDERHYKVQYCHCKTIKEKKKLKIIIKKTNKQLCLAREEVSQVSNNIKMQITP